MASYIADTPIPMTSDIWNERGEGTYLVFTPDDKTGVRFFHGTLDEPLNFGSRDNAEAFAADAKLGHETIIPKAEVGGFVAYLEANLADPNGKINSDSRQDLDELEAFLLR